MLPAIYFATALLLLCFPAGWALRDRVRYVSFNQLMDRRQLPASIRHPATWLDVLRAAGGTWLLSEYALPGLLPGVGAGHPIVMAWIAVVTAAGTALQLAFHRTEPGELHSPLPYIIGVLAAAMPPLVAAPAIVLGVATLFATRLVSVGIATICFGYLLLGVLAGPGAMAALARLPLFLVPLACVAGSNRQFVLPVSAKGLRVVLREEDARYASRLR